MEKVLDDILPIMDVEHDCILSKQGDVTIVFKADLPELNTAIPTVFMRSVEKMVSNILLTTACLIQITPSWRQGIF